MDRSQVLLIVGRVLLGGFFIVAGIQHFFILPAVTAMMTARGVPAAQLVLIVGSIYQIVAGLLVVFNLFAGWAAIALVFFTVVATIMFLNFWDMEGPARNGARSGFEANVGIIGGLLMVASLSGFC